jgi:sulfate adenylyltransferase subunit 1 (EFTu-like GTPase family)
MNDIAGVRLRLAQPVFADTYEANRSTGSFILIDEFTNETVAAGMIR